MSFRAVRARRLLASGLASWLLATAASAQPSPEAFFGFRMGAEGRLAGAEAIERYFTEVAAASPRVRLVDLGPSTDGHRTIAALVSSADNVADLDRIQNANRRLADPRTTSADEADGLTRRQPAIVAIGASIHASEIGATQAMNDVLYRLATATDADTTRVLANLVVILVPMLNPDGHRLVTDWYDRHKGTPFDGGPMPWLYHKYAGHDINRDGFMMNLAESRNLARFFYGAWHPQVFLTLHQMGPDGPRFFVPPNADPIDPNYDPLIWRTAGLLGGAMGFELQREGRKGVVSNGMYDYFWPGYEDSAPLGHNTVCLLTEAASVRVASSLTVAANELRGGQRGFPEYRPLINFPDPWPGGAWTLRDIVDYELTAVNGLLNAVALYREPIVRNFYDMGRRAVEAGRRGGPFAFLIPSEQPDPLAAAKLRELLLQGYVEIHRAMEAFRADGNTYPAGTEIVFLAQPFRAYAKTLLERQRYPAAPGRGGTSERPYDATGWTLPLQMGVTMVTIERGFEAPPLSRVTQATVEPAQVWGERKPGHYIVDARGVSGARAAARLIAAGVPLAWTTVTREENGYAYAPGSFVVARSKVSDEVVPRLARELGLRADGVKGKPPADAAPIGRARLAVYAPWMDSTAEGWTRWLLDQFGFTYTTVRDRDVRAGDLRARFDAIVLPGASADRLLNGNGTEAYPPEYVVGLGDSGLGALRAFVDQGGTIVALDQAGDFAIRTFDLPLHDVTASANADGLLCPGALVHLDLDPERPLAFGMPARTVAVCSSSTAYAGTPARDAEDGAARSRPLLEVVARYAREDLLVSGYLEGGAVIAGQPAVLVAPVGGGRVVLFGMPPHHRGQSLATVRLFVNAVLTSPGPPPPTRRSRR